MTDLVALTQERLKHLLRYDRTSGDFFWIRGRRGKTGNGTKAGCIIKSGYLLIKVDGINYRGHHLAWFYETGEWPTDKIDHKDTVKWNNVFANLREASHAQNQQNSGRQKNNKSGYKGVFFNKQLGTWRAAIGCDGKRYHLGDFETPEEAHHVYVERALALHGEFARVA